MSLRQVYINAFRLLCLLPLLSVNLSCRPFWPEGMVSLGAEKVKMQSGAMFVSISYEGEWELSVEYEGDERNWISLSRESGSGNTNSVILSYTANGGDHPRSAVIRAKFFKSEATARLVQTGLLAQKEGGEGTVIPPSANYPGLVSDVLRGWMELPAVDASDTDIAWVYHDMTIGSGRTVRNYSVYYDAENMISRWVAYPLNQGLIGSGSRQDFGPYDPKVPSDYQAAITQRSYVGDYDRGHQCPSADRLRTEANKATFYPTNMTPQRSSFNQNVWGAVESKVRAWMSAFDTLYVVTGCTPSERDFAKDRSGNRINIPVAYWKALLGYNKAPSERYAGIALYLDHSLPGSTPVSKDMAMSISELEQVTGINFFVNLPDEFADVETRISDRFSF